jgi:NAD+-dependent protein deacetylase sirtuin 4
MSSDIKLLTNFLKRKQNLVCITGAGISTASGIPDYRGINGSYSRGHRPMQHHEFITHEKARKRYWIRSMGGYQHMKNAKPNLGHESLVRLFHLGIVKNIITQNVDNLHDTAAASSIVTHPSTMTSSSPAPSIINLHGVIHEVQCLSCREISSRSHFQNLLENLNPSFVKLLETFDHKNEIIRADGDMNVENVDLTNVRSSLSLSILWIPFEAYPHSSLNPLSVSFH